MNTSPNAPVVDIIMPVYNGEKTIEFALNSLLLQTYAHWRCIVVNDCSTDGTKKILDSLGDSRFKIFHLKKNGGRGAARQFALDQACGDYVAFLDADDFYHPDKIRLQVDYLDKNQDVALVTCGVGSFDQKFKLRTVRAKGNADKRSFKFGDNFNGFCPAIMLRTSLAKEIRYSTFLDVAEDYDYVIRYLDERQYVILPQILYYYNEIGAVSFKKLMYYQTKRYSANFLLFKRNFWYGLTRVIRTTYVIVGYFVLAVAKGVDYILLKRGGPPSESEQSEFEDTFKAIS